MNHIEQAKKAMTDARKSAEWNWGNKGNNIPGGGTGGNNVLTGCVFDNGTNSVVSQYPCHAGIHQFRSARALWSAYGWRGDIAIAKNFFNWLISESPWVATGVIPKQDKDEMFNLGFVWDNLDKLPGNVLHNFLVASRMNNEWYKYIEGWYELVQQGINPALAFVMLTVFTKWIPSGSDEDHFSCFMQKDICVMASADKYDWPLDMARATEQYVLNFLQRLAVNPSKYMFYPTAETAPVNTLWGGLKAVRDKETYLEELKVRYKDLFITEEMEYNHFGKNTKVMLSYLKKKDMLDLIQQEQHRLYGIIQQRKAA